MIAFFLDIFEKNIKLKIIHLEKECFLKELTLFSVSQAIIISFSILN